MKKKMLMDYIDDFIQDGTTRSKAILTGDFKSNNKAYKRMDKILMMAKKSGDAEKFYLEVLCRSNDVTTIITCCAHMMKLNIQTRLARKSLEEVKENIKYPPLLCFNAEMFLKEWDKGNIKPII